MGKDIEDIWDNEEDFEVYNDSEVQRAQQQAANDMLNDGQDVADEIKNKPSRRSMRFNNPDLPTRRHESGEEDSKWDKFRV